MNTGPVVIIEDDEAIGEALEDCLRSEGYGVGWARNGLEGIELLAQTPTAHAVILDLAMPRMNGWEVLRKLRESHTTVPIIVTSADFDETAASQAQFVLQKPYSVRELLQILDELGAEAEERTGSRPAMSGVPGRVAVCS